VRKHDEITEYFYVLTLKDTVLNGASRTSTFSGIWNAAPGMTRSEAYADIKSYVVTENRLNSEPVTVFFSLEKNAL
jgi:hypothetical protein